MKPIVSHLVMGASVGVTVFAIVVPLTHLCAELVVFAGVKLGSWDNPIEIFIFLITAAVAGMFPWGLWIVLTDGRRGNMFDKDYEVAQYLLAAMGVFLTLTLLACTRLQSFYAQFRWFLTPSLLICAAALIYWRWAKVWAFPLTIGLRGIRGILDCAFPSQHIPSR